MPRERRLQRRGARWFVRAVVPPDLRPILKKREIVQALGTADYAEAVSRVKVRSVEIDALFTQARRRAAVSRDGTIHPVAPPAPDLSSLPVVDLSEAVLAGIVKEILFAQERANLRHHAASGDSEAEAEAAADDLAALAGGDLSEVERAADAILAQRGYQLTQDSRRVFVHLLRRAALEEAHRRRARFSGEADVQARDREFADVGATKPPPTANAVTVGLLVDRYTNDPARRDLSQKTRDGYAVVFKLLKQLLGEDTPLTSIDRESCRRVRDVLAALPPNATKRFPALTLEQAAEKAKAEELPSMSPAAANSYLNNLAALFNYAVKEQYVTANPATGLRIGGSVSKKARKKPFTADRLAAIFNAPLFTGCVDDGAGYATPGPNRPRRGRFWLPLLALFTGARLNELAQLHVADVKDIDGVTCILVREEADAPGDEEAGEKRVKSEAGERLIPIHPELRRLGFLAYAQAMRKAGTVRLFPDLKPGRNGYFSDPLQKWFKRFLVKAGAAGPKTSFHSFRHAFRDALREGGVRVDAVRALGGWAGGGGAEELYGGGLRPSSLAREIAKVRYPGLDLSHLYPKGR